MNSDAFLLIGIVLYTRVYSQSFMNLRHSKPSYSYSECAPSPKISEIKVKQDPMLRYHAQLLTNFIERTNLKFLQFQEKRRNSKSKKKSKGKNKCNRKGIKITAKKFKSKPQSKNIQNELIIDVKKTKDQTQITINHQNDIQTKKQQDFEFPIQFIQILLNICGQVQSDDETGPQFPQKHNVRSHLKYLCSIHPQWLPLLDQLYTRNYFIQGFHPSHLSNND